MPTQLPNSRPPRQNGAKTMGKQESREWPIVWALSIGFSALLLAAVLHFNETNSLVVTAVLGIASALMTLILNATGISEQHE
jgi:hypothetical protein